MLQGLWSKLLPIKSKRILIFIDSKLISNFFNFNQNKNTKISSLESPSLILSDFIKELIIFISELYHFQDIALVFDSLENQKLALSVAHHLKKQSVLNDSIIFKII